MNLLKINTLLFFILILINCNKKKEGTIYNINALPLIDTLRTSKVINLNNEALIYKPFKILNISDEYLIIASYENNDFLKVFKLPELNFLYSWGINGRGPQEFDNTPVFYQSRTNKTIIIHDVLSRKVEYFTVNDSSMNYVKTLNLEYDGQIDPLNNIIQVKENLFFADYGTSYEDTNREYIALSPQSKNPVFLFGEYPNTELTDISRYFKYSKKNIFNPQDSIFATFYSNYNRFKFFDIQGSLLKEIHVMDSITAKKDNSSESNLDEYFLYRFPTWASEKYIYFYAFNEFSSKVFDKPNSNFQTSLEVWDWQGNPVSRIMFDRFIRNFTVSEKYGKLYGYSLENEDKIYVYDISQLLK